MNKPDSRGIENREQDVRQRFDQFLVGIQGQLSELKEAMSRRNQVSEGVGGRHIASLVDRLWSRVTKRASDAETIAKLAPSIWRQYALFFRTLSPTDIIRLADEKKWPIHLTNDHSDQPLETSSPRILVRVQDIPAYNGVGTPDDPYSCFVIVFADSDVTSDTEELNPVRILPAGNDKHEQLRTKGLHARDTQRDLFRRISLLAGEKLDTTTDLVAKRNLEIVRKMTSDLGLLDKPQDELLFVVEEILIASLGYAKPDMNAFEERINQALQQFTKRIIDQAKAAGLDVSSLEPSSVNDGLKGYR